MQSCEGSGTQRRFCGTAEAHAAGLDMEMWEAWYCQDGVTVFFGTNKENQDVLMVSLIVRAPPNLVTEVHHRHAVTAQAALPSSSG